MWNCASHDPRLGHCDIRPTPPNTKVETVQKQALHKDMDGCFSSHEDDILLSVFLGRYTEGFNNG